MPLGPAGVATFAHDADGSFVSRYAFATDIIRSRSGKETRAAILVVPRETHECALLVTKAESQVINGSIHRNVPQAQSFNLAMWPEAMPVASYSGSVLTVAATTLADWCVVDHRVIVVDAANVAYERHIASTTSTTITLDSTLPAYLSGVFVMPMNSVMVEATTFGRYSSGMDRVDVKFFSLNFTPFTGAGSTVTTFYGAPVFDRPIVNSNLNSETIMPDSEAVDFGTNKTWQAATRTRAEWMRQIEYTIVDDSSRQWVKKFFVTIKGRQKMFWLPTWEPNLALHTQPVGNTMAIKIPPNINTVNWATTWAERDALQLTQSNGTVSHVRIIGSTDLGGGVMQLTFDASPPASVVMISFLDRCRLDTDELAIEWTPGGSGRVSLQAMVVDQ
jgi:hypothetical protein